MLFEMKTDMGFRNPARTRRPLRRMGALALLAMPALAIGLLFAVPGETSAQAQGAEPPPPTSGAGPGEIAAPAAPPEIAPPDTALAAPAAAPENTAKAVEPEFAGLGHQARLALDPAAAGFVLIASALVLMMTIPGLALFYGGMVRRKNVIATVTQSFAITVVVSIVWMIGGYAMAFGVHPDPTLQQYFGGFEALFLNGVKADTAHAAAAYLPEFLWIAYQMTFAIITVALICGAYAERLKFSGMMLFSTLWLLLVYAPVCHWVWGGGFLGTSGVLDFAGGTVVHINAGVAGLVAAVFLGKRQGYGQENMAPHNLVLTMIGASLLWVGWFGFNAGSAWTPDGIASAAFLNTQLGAAGAALSWMLVEWIHRRKPGILGLASGAVAGLVAITPAAGFVNPQGALVIGLIGGVTGYLGAVFIKKALRYDDSLDAFGVHGLCGIAGALLTGMLADPSVNALGEGASVVKQAFGIGVTIGWSALATFVILVIVKFTTGLRVTPDAETEGLDIALHGEALHN